MTKHILSLSVLTSLRKHETLTLPDLLLEKNIGFEANAEDLKEAVKHLEAKGLIQSLDVETEPTYTITTRGIEEEKYLSESAILAK